MDNIWPWTHFYQIYKALSTGKFENKAIQLTRPSNNIVVTLFRYLIGCHLAHTTDFLVAVICYLFFFPIEKAAELKLDWILTVFIFNLSVEFIFYGGWHFILYGPFSKRFWGQKFNQENQYDSGNLKREMTYTTLGFLQSSVYQIVMMHLMASNKITWYSDFWRYPLWSIFWVGFVTYWREFHFYWCHRMMHPWRRQVPIFGDIGNFLYLNFHKVHHLSYNTGPWSGISMHPVEHFIYYTCTLLPLFIPLHPFHFLYAKFHADISPIAGHDGFADPPGGGSDYHYLHHTKFEVNYGVPLMNFDKLFGTWLDFKDLQEEKDSKKAKEKEIKTKKHKK
jgi:sterol desaturase/sphingolipid hydroxylase (fatty acid hydroxylase superfamily)